MKKQSSIKIVIIIGAISTLTGIWQVFSGESFQDYFFTLFIGITLIGTGWITERGSKKE